MKNQFYSKKEDEKSFSPVSESLSVNVTVLTFEPYSKTFITLP